MPEEVQNGLAALSGIRNDGSPVTIEGYASFILDSAKLAHKFKLDSIEDELGFDTNLMACNGHVELDIQWTPAGATRAAAEDTAAFLPPLSKVTLTHFAVDAVNGDWIYIGDGSIDLSKKAGKMSLKLRKYDDEDQNDSLTTTVTG